MRKSYNNQKHGFHLVDPSPWPILTAFSALIMVFGFVLYMHSSSKSQYVFGCYTTTFGLILIILMISCWWRDVVREGTIEGQHTSIVQKGLKLGMVLFILSEVMFFFAFFWAFFHSSFNPSLSIGGVWPPAFMIVIDPWKIPLLNTVFLLTSGASITYSHYAITEGCKVNALSSLAGTIFLATVFSALQTVEYCTATFTISDNIYASTFYMITGLHGFHVFVGALFLKVCLARLYLDHFTIEHHLGFEAAAWYWHFVDVVWLFVFIFVYWWGGA
jgi:cytochrome c oxidase subunit 3